MHLARETLARIRRRHAASAARPSNDNDGLFTDPLVDEPWCPVDPYWRAVQAALLRGDC